MTSIGAHVPAAIQHLAEAGYPVRQIAEDLGVARSTVYRWRSGRTRPNAGNFAALAERVNTWYSTEVHRRRASPPPSIRSSWSLAAGRPSSPCRSERT